MKRLILCASFLIVILTFSTLMMSYLKKQNNIMTSKIDTAISLWDQGKNDEAISAAKDTQKFWEKYYVLISFVISQDKLQPINESVSKLIPYLTLKNDEFYIECESIKAELELLYANESLTLRNII